MISQNVRAYLKSIGRKGGKARARKSGSMKLSIQARHAVVSRWMRKRFGTDTFRDLALPGWEIVDSGLRDLVNGEFSSVHALAVAELRPKLHFLGVPMPDSAPHISHPRALLYRAMEKAHGEMAYVRFCALLERLDSFCDALAVIVFTPRLRRPRLAAHRHRRWCA